MSVIIEETAEIIKTDHLKMRQNNTVSQWMVELVSVVGQKMKTGGRDGQVRGRRQRRGGERGLLGKKEFKDSTPAKARPPQPHTYILTFLNFRQ